MRRRIGLRAAATLCAALAMTACGLQQGLSQNPSGSGPTGIQATPITASTLTGGAYDWAATRGHVVVLDFWGSWCGPCRLMQPQLNRLAATYLPKGVIFLGVDVRDDVASATAFDREYSVAYPSVNDSDLGVTAAYNVLDPPSVVVVDQHGRIVDRFDGTASGVSADLDRLL